MSQTAADLARAARQAFKSRDWSKAVRLYEALTQQRGARKDWIGYARVLSKSGAPDAAIAALDAADAKGGVVDESAALRLAILQAEGRTAEAAEAAKSSAPVSGEDETTALRRLKALDKAEDPARFPLAEDLLSAFPDSLDLYGLILDRIADPISRADLRARAIAGLERIAETASDPLPAITRLCSVAVKAADSPSLKRWAQAGQDRAPEDVRFGRWLNKADALDGDGLGALTKAGEADEALDDEGGSVLSQDDPRLGARRYNAAVAMIDAGDIEGGVAALEALAADIEADARCAPGNIRRRLSGFLDAMRTICDTSPAGSGLPAKAFDRIFDGPVIHREPGARCVVVAFCAGLTRRAAWTRYFAGFGVHQVFVDDARRLGGLTGMSGLGADPREAARSLAALTAELGAERAIYYGFSIGGFAALLHAALTPADAVITASPASLADPRAFTEAERRRDRRVWSVIPRYQRDLPLPDGMSRYPFSDLREFYGPGKDHPRAHVFFNDGRSEDRLHAERIAGGAGMTQSALPGEHGHWSDLAAIASGRLGAALRAAIAGD